jgi:hypothetical protein
MFFTILAVGVIIMFNSSILYTKCQVRQIPIDKKAFLAVGVTPTDRGWKQFNWKRMNARSTLLLNIIKLSIFPIASER